MRRQGNNIARLISGVFAACALGPVAAHAQEPGVMVDPDSPSGREYAIPSEEGRNVGGGGSKAAPGAGGGGTGSSDGADPALFGRGVSPATEGGDGNPSDRRDRSGTKGPAGGKDTTPAKTVDAPARSADEVVPSASSGFPAAGLAILLVMIAAGLLAVVGIRLRGRTPPRGS